MFLKSCFVFWSFFIVFLKLFGMFVVCVCSPKIFVVLLADSYVSLCNFGSSLETLLAEGPRAVCLEALLAQGPRAVFLETVLTYGVLTVEGSVSVTK